VPESVAADSFRGFLNAVNFLRRNSPRARFRGEAIGVRSFFCPDLAVIFPVYGVADVMALVLDSPVAAGESADVGDGHLLCLPAGEDEGVFLADAAAG
jgi:hypothetical protein